MGIAVLAVTGVAVKVFSGVGVNDGVDDGLLVDSGVAVFVGVFTGVLVGVLVWVLVGVDVHDGVGVGVGVGEPTQIVGVAFWDCALAAEHSNNTNPNNDFLFLLIFLFR